MTERNYPYLVEFELIPIVIRYIEPVVVNSITRRNLVEKYRIEIKYEASYSTSLEQILPGVISLPLTVGQLMKIELARPVQKRPEARYLVNYYCNDYKVGEQYWVLPHMPILDKIIDKIEYKSGGIQLPERLHTVRSIFNRNVEIKNYEVDRSNRLIIEGLEEGEEIKIVYKPGLYVGEIIEQSPRATVNRL